MSRGIVAADSIVPKNVEAQRTAEAGSSARLLAPVVMGDWVGDVDLAWASSSQVGGGRPRGGQSTSGTAASRWNIWRARVGLPLRARLGAAAWLWNPERVRVGLPLRARLVSIKVSVAFFARKGHDFSCRCACYGVKRAAGLAACKDEGTPWSFDVGTPWAGKRCGLDGWTCPHCDWVLDSQNLVSDSAASRGSVCFSEWVGVVNTAGAALGQIGGGGPLSDQSTFGPAALLWSLRRVRVGLPLRACLGAAALRWSPERVRVGLPLRVRSVSDKIVVAFFVSKGHVISCRMTRRLRCGYIGVTRVIGLAEDKDEGTPWSCGCGRGGFQSREWRRADATSSWVRALTTSSRC